MPPNPAFSCQTPLTSSHMKAVPADHRFPVLLVSEPREGGHARTNYEPALLPSERGPDIRNRSQPVGVQRVDRHYPVHIELQALQILQKNDRAGHRGIRNRIVRRWKIEHVG